MRLEHYKAQIEMNASPIVVRTDVPEGGCVRLLLDDGTVILFKVSEWGSVEIHPHYKTL